MTDATTGLDTYRLKSRPSEIIRRILRFYHLDRKAFMSECKYKEYVRARDVFTWIARERLDLSYPRIGRALHRHHTTIIIGYKRALRLYATEKEFRDEIAFIEAMIRTTHEPVMQ